jgi:hypothetical protein
MSILYRKEEHAMRQTFHVIMIAVIFSLSACKSDVNSPTQIMRSGRAPLPRQAMELTHSEQEMIDDFLKPFPSEKAARLRAMFSRNDVTVASGDPERQKKINAIYAAISARRASQSRAAGYYRSPSPAQNSWVPNADEELLIQTLLNRAPAEYRRQLRERLLRTDQMVVAKKNDPQSQKLIDQIYQLRQKRMAEEENANWKK